MSTEFRKRRSIIEDESSKRPRYSLEDDESDDDNSRPYVSVVQRREEQLAKLTGIKGNTAAMSKAKLEAQRRQKETEEELREKERIAREKTLLIAAQEVKRKQAEQDARKTAEQKRAEEEAEILRLTNAAQRKLQSDRELAQGIVWTEPLKSSWTPPSFVRRRTPEENAKIREKHAIVIETTGGEPIENVPPPITAFQDMKLIPPVLRYLKERHIAKPTPIQLQGLPVAFSGRDLIGVAFTGSGKTLSFSLPLLMAALEEEKKLPFVNGEGPVGLVVCPSRELAKQTYEQMCLMAKMCADDGYPQIGVVLAIGGINMSEQSHIMSKGFHIVVATPGRLQDMLEKKKFNLDLCRYLCLDEADRMIDMGFEDDVRNIMSYFKHQRQTLLYSATMPAKIREFAQSSLVKPITVNIGRAGAANLDVIQEVEYVKQEAKMVYLLECLQKTAPPVIIFSDNKNEVDDIQEYLLRKGVEAVAIHGSKSPEEREYAFNAFKSGKKDVMVASGVASKGLDFAAIQHVINFTMPKEIEDYVHQIGRTGRSGKTGLATTFVNMNTPEETLLDLKYLLIEAGQKITPFLESIQDPNAGSGGCTFCGGLGHTIATCPKRHDTERRVLNAQRGDRDAGAGDY